MAVRDIIQAAGGLGGDGPVTLVGYKTVSTTATTLNVTTDGLSGGVSSTSAVGDVAVIVTGRAGVIVSTQTPSANKSYFGACSDTYDFNVQVCMYYITSAGQSIVDADLDLSPTASTVHVYVFRSAISGKTINIRNLSLNRVANTSTVTFTSATPSFENSLILAIGGSSVSVSETGLSYTKSNTFSSYTESNNNSNGTDLGVLGVGVYKKNWQTGQIDVGDWTLSSTTALSSSVGFLFELYCSQDAYFGATNQKGIVSVTTTYSWVVPSGVTSVDIVAVGGGEGGGSRYGGDGGYLSYVNNQTVTPGETLTIIAGLGGAGGTSTSSSAGSNGANSSVVRSGTTVVLAPGGASTTSAVGTSYAGGNGGAGVAKTGTYGTVYNGGGGGGAGGYAGVGGNQATAGAGGAGGGGGYDTSAARESTSNGGYTYGSQGTGGGGVDVYGQGANGTAGVNSTTPVGGGGGSDGIDGTATYAGLYGAGGGGGFTRAGNYTTPSSGDEGSKGVVRIIWGTVNGSSRNFPSTNTLEW